MNNINQQNTMSTSHTLNLDMPIQEDGLLNDQPSFDQLWTENYPIQHQPHQASSFSHLLTQSMLSENTNMDTLEKEEDQGNKLLEQEEEHLSPMREMVYKIAAMQPVDIDPATIPKPTRRNVRISDEPQSVAARLRREKISEKIRILQRLVPGGVKMDTASMLDEAIRYVKFLKRQIRQLQGNYLQLQPCNVGSSWQVQPNINISIGHSTAPVSSSELTTLQPLGHNFVLEANWDETTNTFPFNNEVTSDN